MYRLLLDDTVAIVGTTILYCCYCRYYYWCVSR